HPHYYSKGIATQLLKALIQAAKKLHYHVMIGGIDANNEVSLKLHKKLGFMEVGHLPQVAFKFDSWLDLKFLQLILV
ncbi:MAG: N-acetyltransferase, partial [Bacteroidetes bacterium]|nr:N-acetyltransferase [Bacteroidota bacterium]